MLNDYLDVLQAAQALHLHPETVKRLIRTQKLKALKFGNKWLLTKTDVQGYLPTGRRAPKPRRAQIGEE